jgi:hypothetical protein
MGSVNITLANGGLGGTLQTNDGICGMVLTGASEGDYTVGTVELVTGVASAEAKGITATGNPFAARQIVDFYNAAGDGAQLYIMLVPDTMDIAQIALKTNADGAIKLLNAADGAVRLLGIMTDDANLAETPTQTAGLNTDIAAAAANLAALANDFFLAHKPFRAVIGGTSYTGDPADLTTVNSGTTNNRTAILIGDTQATEDEDGIGATACLGLLLGRAAVNPVQRKVSRVRSGALPGVTEAYVGPVDAAASVAGLPVIAGKGYITFARYANVAGWFFSGDPMMTATTDDYSMLCRGRIIDKAHVLAYTTFVQSVDDEVPINEDGTLDAGFCRWLSQQMVNQINNTMTVNREISSVSCFIDPAQNILSTNELRVVINIVPVAYATNIKITLGFANPALA